MLKNIINYNNFYENEDKNELEKLADFYTVHIDFYSINNPVTLYLGRNGHLFRITAYSRETKLKNTFNCFGNRWCYAIAELVGERNTENELKSNWINYGSIPTFSHQFPLDAIEIFMWCMSIEDEELYV